ncbi:pyridoxal-phosphate dependent enzyme [Halanaerobium sp. Z-7514]|uniref:Pyridoxal-phosphate dependent enzyme n=1 Tax=Halanaerobium polyolivorans TaxID=2886943 RepID=A0AAW4WTH9_9FIRM|nr:pyridoxal-phosphate dependent enzyme [Halanaerobium polyolivorans]MCC3144291.1 pyridoxal-phosphate dependent enzyme [Halanaerobium polyolivorans]RQD78907.1 MAG: pyridoxal-phosphate dependent enzyme [Halanaerobium sp. MSAO_Bac5]
MINLDYNSQGLEKAVEQAKENNIILPTFAQMKDPDLIPDLIKEKLKDIGLWDINSYNLFRISWKNEPQKEGGLYDGVNYIEFPSELTGVKARIFAIVGKWFPTGAHKVGATYGCLVPQLVTGQFNPASSKAVWPSTGNYCRGGAYNSQLLACDSIAILPRGMSKERFEWLEKVAGEVIATPGTESNVKEIFDKVWELKKTRDNITVFNQFEEFGNHLWHYEVTGAAMEEVIEKEKRENDNYFAFFATSGSAGTLGAGDYLKDQYPKSKIAVGEALQCPTILSNGFGAHRIEGIGDKHIPWVHNVKNTDMAVAIDDERTMSLLRLFNEKAGREYLLEQGIPEDFIAKIELLGISGIANLVGAIKMAKYYELDEKQMLITVLTDSLELYSSRLEEMRAEQGEYSREDAVKDYHRYLRGITTENTLEMGLEERRRVHNLKYYTWVEQQGRSSEELEAQWYDYDNYWGGIHSQAEEIDKLIIEFNQKTGLLDKLKNS